MKNVLLIALFILVLILGWLWYNQKAEISSLTENSTLINDSLSATNQNLASVISDYDFLKKENDSVKTAFLNSIKASENSGYSQEEMEIHSLVIKVHNAWEEAFENKDPDFIVNNFMPEFTTNEVVIDTKNLPHVERHNDRNFKEHLEKLIATNYILDFGSIEFLNTFVRDNIFTTTYRTDFRVLDQNRKVIQKSNIISYVSGEKHEGKWKIGNYSWTKYDNFSTIN